MSSPQYFDFIGSVWSFLPDEDKNRMAELWHGYEQVFAAVYQQYVEVNLNIAIQDMQPYSTTRWLPYTFDSTPTDEAYNFISKPAQYTSTQDISIGVNLASKYLIRFSIDGGPQIEVNLQGPTPVSTTPQQILFAINQAAGFTFAALIFSGTILQFTSSTTGVGSNITFYPPSNVNLDASEYVLGLETNQLPLSLPKFPWIFSLPYPLLVSIPTLTDKIRPESVTLSLTQGVDYALDGLGNIGFLVQPPESVWAQTSLFNIETPWNNFGFLMQIYQPNSTEYVDVLQGLWYAFWNGPTPYNVQTSLYLLFGLPTAQEEAVVTALTATTIQTTGTATGIVRTFNIPSGLTAIVTLGQVLPKFTPLVSGITVLDKINSPGFIASQVGRAGIARFLTQNATLGPGPNTDETMALTLLEQNCFLPQVDVNAFINPNINLANVKTFLNAIKPLSKAWLFQVIVGTFLDPISFAEEMGNSVLLDVTPNVDSNQTTLDDAADLLAYETVDNPDLGLDSDVVFLQETLEVDIYEGADLIGSFTI